MYAIVEFENKSASAIPSKWLNEEEEQCYWPKPNSKDYSKIGSLIKKCLSYASDWVIGCFIVLCTLTCAKLLFVKPFIDSKSNLKVHFALFT